MPDAAGAVMAHFIQFCTSFRGVRQVAGWVVEAMAHFVQFCTGFGVCRDAAVRPAHFIQGLHGFGLGKKGIPLRIGWGAVGRSALRPYTGVCRAR